MTIRPAAAFAVVLVVGLAGCVGPPGPPWTEAASPNSITLRWYADDVSPAAARQVADAHCSSTGRNAALDTIELDGSAEIASYLCR